MKTAYLLLLITLPFVAAAQKDETLAANKQTKAERENQTFIFPDNIKVDKNELNERVEKKTIKLTRYIKMLAEAKDNPKPVIDAAMKLFNNNEKAQVSVTRNGQTNVETMLVRVYLNRLTQLKYDKVRIVWHNAQYVSNFTKQPNGTYRGLVAFEQEFTGMKNGEINYTFHDVTQKRVEVDVKVWNAKGEDKKAYMDVFLGNIGVIEE